MNYKTAGGNYTYSNSPLTVYFSSTMRMSNANLWNSRIDKVYLCNRKAGCYIKVNVVNRKDCKSLAATVTWNHNDAHLSNHC